MIKDIIWAPTTWSDEHGHEAVHESIFKSYQLLEFTRSLLRRNVSAEIIMMLVDELEKITPEECLDIFLGSLKTPEQCADLFNRLEKFMKNSDIGFCDACGWFHEIERGDNFNQCEVEGMDDKWVCNVCGNLSLPEQEALITQRQKLLG